MVRVTANREDLVAVIAELFRDHGYEGTSLSMIEGATKLGRGSLYHFFPSGKADMLNAVLADIESWFERNVFAPLDQDDIAKMHEAVDTYFRSGRRVCLVGVLALTSVRDEFAVAIERFFSRWISSLAAALSRQNDPPADPMRCAQRVVASIQGALMLSRALDDESLFRHVTRAPCARTDTHRLIP